MTERARNWFPHPRSPGLVALQIVLVASGVMLFAGRRVWEAGMVAGAARAAEAFVFFPLNDFFFVSVVCVLLAHSNGGPFERARRPRWVHDALLVQLAWIYVATRRSQAESGLARRGPALRTHAVLVATAGGGSTRGSSRGRSCRLPSTRGSRRSAPLSRSPSGRCSSSAVRTGLPPRSPSRSTASARW